MGLIAWIVVGAIAGFIATRRLGMLDGVERAVILGIVGAVIVVFVANMLEVRRRGTV